MLENLEPKDILPSIPKAWIIGPAVLILGFAGVATYSCVKGRQVAVHVQQADQDHTAAASSAAQGAAHDQEAATEAPQIQNDAVTVAQLRAEVARLRTPHAPAPEPPAAPGLPAPEPVAPPVDLAAVVAKQDLLIAAQDKQIGDQAEQIHTLTLARDSWRLSAQDSAAEAVQLRSALAAKEGVLKAQRWMGRLEGLAVGFGSGYVAGRLH